MVAGPIGRGWGAAGISVFFVLNLGVSYIDF
jgi:hypothetical protein